MVGGTLLNCLTKSKMTNKLKIAVIDKNATKQAENTNVQNEDKPMVPGIRVSALTPLTINLFERLSVFDTLRNRRPTNPNWFYSPFTGMRVWDQSNLSSVSFNAPTSDPLGCIMDNDILVSGLMENVKNNIQDGSIQVIDGEVSAIKLPQQAHHNPNLIVGDEKAVLTMRDGSCIKASLLVGCDGVNSAIRSMATVPSLGWDYKQRALVATIRTSIPHSIAYQRFLSTGPIAMLPCTPDGLCSNIVWSTTPEHAYFLMTLEADDLVKAINNAFHDGQTNNTPDAPMALEIVQQEKKPWRGAFPLRRMHVSEYVRSRFALAGDAAHAIHPMAGQGVNLGIVDAVQMTKCLQECIRSGADLGDVIMLRKHYQSVQFKRNELMMDQLEFIKRSFDVGPNVPLFPKVRALGMSILDKTDFIKDKVLKFASGSDVKLDHIGGII
ncbi:ubiquinone biosynthesis monooxygenase [Acrasis kona]|uniref:Ubiquinone biosynthesis monooxygenase n=1 Tax=Acrasis kona TaxID=1008807 RepID=A0AAW2YIU9_9EUKA